MSNIVGSTYTADVQADGRQQVHEVHTDLIGLTHTLDYLAAADADLLGAALAEHADQMSVALHDSEIIANLTGIQTLGAGATPTNVYSPVADNVAAAQAAFPTMSVGQALMFAAFMVAQPDAVLEAAYGFTTDQVAALRALPTVAEQQAALSAVVNPGGG